MNQIMRMRIGEQLNCVLFWGHPLTSHSMGHTSTIRQENSSPSEDFRLVHLIFCFPLPVLVHLKLTQFTEP